MFKFYEVGGKIRDELLGLTNKDVDYVAVPTDELLSKGYTAEEMFKLLYADLAIEKFEIFLVTPDCYTIRARFPEGYKYQGVADFVMARKEVGYIPGTRTPIVEPGNLYDDLSRRDFTVNALAKDPDTGEIIDYFGGKADLWAKILRTPLDPIKTFDDDPLRILRGIRFMITKDFSIHWKVWDAIIVDMDATLCYNTSKRPFWGEGAAEGMLNDIENIPVADLVRLMHSQGCKVLIVTGREGAPDIMEATKTWLKDHSIPYDDIFFRPYKDYSKGAPTKQKIFEENISPRYNVRFVLDDNYKCVKMYRDLGLTVLQPNEGKF